MPTPGAAQCAEPTVDQIILELKKEDPAWLSSTLRTRWAEVNRNRRYSTQIHTELDEVSHAPPNDEISTEVKYGHQHSQVTDITLQAIPEGVPLPEYVRFIRSYDWAATELGPPSSWSLDVRRMAEMCLADGRAAAIWIGPRRLGFYNEAYAEISAKKHPMFLGRPFDMMWPEPSVNESFTQMFRFAETTLQGCKGDDVSYVLERKGFREEMWASWSLTPLSGSTGSVIGIYNSVFDTTKQQVSSRRLSTLLWLGHCTSLASSISDFWKQIVKSCQPNTYDVPFAVLYSLAQIQNNVPSNSDGMGTARSASPARSERSSTIDSKRWNLEGTIGIPPDFAGLPDDFQSDAASELLTPSFSIAITGGKPVILRTSDGTFPKILQGVAKSQTYGDECDSAILFPIGPTNRENVLGFMIIGINPLLRYDADYQQFVQLLVRQCGTSMASVMLIEEEMHRSRIAAALATQDRIRLSAQLAESQQIAQDNETRFRRMADLAPVAMFNTNDAGKIVYANRAWIELTEHPPERWADMSWLDVIHPDDKELIHVEWAKLVNGDPVSFETRLMRPFIAEGGEFVNGERVEGPTWIIASAYSETRPDGSLKGILGCLTDISRQKWMEGFQERRMIEALELKRQQENFMDMTSHEARNPLSAIMLCTESILTTFKEILASQTDPVLLTKDTIRTNMEGAEIIMACAQHQKRIIDDVLTLSKLDSGMLMICPVETQPTEAVTQALRMLDSDLRKSDVDLDVVIDDSYRQLGIEWVRIDPSRLLQVLINLLTNAIKFTQTEAHRRITVTLGASKDRPTSSIHGVQYISNTGNGSPQLEGSGDVYLQLEVTDTGRGITEEEIKGLFQRFQQASPKTHVEYGGSGLGLFISRELTRMQGGAIGVASPGNGATFAFYVKASPCSAPHVKDSHLEPLRSRSRAPERTLTPETLNQNNKKKHGDADSATHKLAELKISSKGRVLVVEDNLVNQKVMRQQLQRAQYAVNVANHGLEALEHIKKTKFCTTDGEPLDIVLMDVEMPICDGLECVRRIRQMQRDGSIVGHVPIIGVTANARAEQQAAATRAGMDAVVTKPFRMLELLPEVERIRQMYTRLP